MSQDCIICLCTLGSSAWKLPCGHIFHKGCLRTLYKSTKNCYTEDTFEELVPSCPICRRRIRRRHLPDVRIHPEAAARRFDQHQRVISEPAFAQMSLDERPLRLARAIIVVERAERQRALDELIAQRERLNRQRAQDSESRPQPSTSSGFTASGNFRAHLEPDSSSSSGPSQSSPSRGLPSALNLISTNCSPSHHSRRSRSPISVIDLTKDSQSPVKTPPLPSRKLHEAQQQLQRLTISSSDDIQDLNMRIHIISDQLSQMPSRNVIFEVDSPPRHDENDSDIEDDDLEPTVILGTWGRGRHMRYRIGWSDGSVTINPTREVELLGTPLLESYRRELRRQATARTRERQRLGIAPKIAGRGRGRGRGSK